jgi:histone deacetylase complex regulatory component SIN3
MIFNSGILTLSKFFSENVMTIQVLGKEDQLSDDAISSEEKWSLYVDQFVQLSTTENGSSKRRDPFLKRNLPTHVGEDPPLNVETKSGLELKICVNTYKIFFVDNTEDYFRRKRPVNSGSALGLCQTEKIKTAESRSNKFHRSLLMQKWSENLTSSECSHSLVTLKKMGFTN